MHLNLMHADDYPDQGSLVVRTVWIVTACTAHTHLIGFDDLGLQRVAEHSKGPQLVGDVLRTKAWDFQYNTFVNQVQQLAIARI